MNAERADADTGVLCSDGGEDRRRRRRMRIPTKHDSALPEIREGRRANERTK